MNYQEAKLVATQLTGRQPRWCEVRDEQDELAPAPTTEAMNDCIALDSTGNRTPIGYWLDQRPMGENVEAVCYF